MNIAEVASDFFSRGILTIYYSLACRVCIKELSKLGPGCYETALVS